MSPKDLLDRANALSAEDRVRLVLAIWDSIPPELRGFELSGEQTAVLDRRLADMRANPQIGLTWDEVKAQVKGRR